MLIPHTFAFKHGYLFKHIFLFFFFFNFVTMNNKAHTEHQSVSKSLQILKSTLHIRVQQ